MDKEKFLSTGLLELYVLGLASKEEQREVEKHLRAFPELREQVRMMQKQLKNYASQELSDSPTSIKSVEKDVAQSGNGRPMSLSNSNYRRVFATIIGVSLAIILFLGYLKIRKVEQQVRIIDEERLQVAALYDSCEKERQTLLEIQRVYAIINHPKTKVLLLTGSAIEPDAMATVYWSEHFGTALCNPSGLPKLSDDQQYQVWADVEGKMVNVGLLKPGVSDLQSINFLPDAASLNITIERLGGNKYPTVSLLTASGKM